MTDKTPEKRLKIELVQAKNGGFALYIDGEFDTACSKGDEALEWFAKQMKETFGETTRRSIEHASLIDQIAGKVADQLSKRPAQQAARAPVQHPSGYAPFMPSASFGGLPPELPQREQPDDSRQDEYMPRIVDDMRDAADPETAKLTARLASEMNHSNGRMRTSVLALVALPVAMALWKYSAAFGLSA